MNAVAPVLRWLQEAPVRERRTTAALTILATALVTLALVPAPSERTEEMLDTGQPLSAGGAASSPEAVVPGSPADSITSASIPGATVPASSATTSTAPVRGGSTVQNGPRTATDRGVSADAIKVGFTVVNYSAAHAAGIVPGVRDDVSEAIDALVDHANDRGGVLGRRIEPVKVSPDIASADDQRQKCLELTETNGVFAVIDSFAFWYERSSACVTAEHKTLLLTGEPGSSANVRLGFPYHVSVQNDDNRKMKNLVVSASSAGFFDPANGFERLGIFQESCEPTIYDSPADGLKTYLKAAGVTEWTSFTGACPSAASAAAAQGDAARAVLQFQQDGVTDVLLVVHPPGVKSFLDAAGQAKYYPQYFSSDYYNVVLGGLVDKYEPMGFDGARAVTQTHAGEAAVGKPLSPRAQECSKIFTDHGVAPVVAKPPYDLGDDIEVLELCESFLLFLQVANAAGPNLTRKTWIDALAGVGDFRAATTDLARFDRRGKMTGGDTMKLVQWHRNCKCWKELTTFGPAAG